MSNERAILNLKALSFSLAVILIGAIALFTAANESSWSSEEWRVLTRELGALFVVTGALSVFWELLAKRTVIDEVLSRVGIVRNINDSGLLEVTPDFKRDINWERLFQNVRELDIFFAYGRSWQGAHDSKLREVAARGKGHIRVVLPAPEDARIVAELARRFSTEPADIARRIHDTVTAFEELGKASPARIEVWFLPRPPVFSYYRFDDEAIFATYHPRDSKWQVPAFTFARGGSLFEYFEGEFEAMISGDAPSAHLVYRNQL